MNAEDILNRTIGGYDKIKKQRGWQGINAAEYIKVRVSSYFDTQGNHDRTLYGKLSDILLDKAYLSDDKNLDILISAADKLYDNKKITIEQFGHVAFMLCYAYELRKLSNEKGGQLNSDIGAIKLNKHSRSVLTKMFEEISNE